MCGISNQEKNVYYRTKFDTILCDKHFAQMIRYNRIIDPTSRTINDKNEIIYHDSYAEIVIRNKKNDIVAIAKIDLEDVERVSLCKWNVLPCKNKIYIYTKHPNHIKLHRYILNYSGSMDIDHINRDPLDNRKQNLRIVTRSENASNTNAKHVYRIGNSWRYEIIRYGKRFTKSGFKSFEDASAALQKCLSDVSSRVNELIDQFNKKCEINPYKGVYLKNGKYQALYYYKGTRYYVGTFPTPKEAFDARAELIKKLNLE